MNTIPRVCRSYRLRKIISSLLILCMLHLNVPTLWAINGADPVSGNVTVGQAPNAGGGNTTTVNVFSDQAIINWDNLDTLSADVLQFLRDGGDFAVLNRVVQGGATQFDGSLLGNQGHIFIVNPNGIIFGPTAFIQARNFTAAAMHIEDADFMEGNYLFSGGMGSVENYGEITAEQAALIGKKVLNAGSIVSPDGFVLMAAADEVYLSKEGSDIVVELAGTLSLDPAEISVENQGTIDASEGLIILAAGDLAVQAIEGLDNLRAAVEYNTEAGNGKVVQSGTLTADSADGNGGNILLTAADKVILADGSMTSANAAANGNGGDVIAYSPDTAVFHQDAKVEAKGGTESGDGGFFELSGEQMVAVMGQIDLSAANGTGGHFLIDPRNIIINDSGNNDGGPGPNIWSPSSDDSELDIDLLEQYLDGQSVTITTGTGGTQEGWVLFDAGRDLYDGTDHVNGSGYSLTVNAADDIRLVSGITFNADGNVELNAGDDVRLGYLNSNSGITMNGGDLTINAACDDITIAGSGIDMAGIGNAFLNAGDNIELGYKNTNASITSDGANLTMNANDDIIIGGGGVTLGGSGDASINANSNIFVNSAIDVGGNLALRADHNHEITGDMISSDGTTLTAGEDIEIRGNDIVMGGAVDAGGNLTIVGRDCHPIEWGNVHAKSTLTAGGNIDISVTGEVTRDNWVRDKNTGQIIPKGFYPGTITLDDDVTAGENLSLFNDTFVADGVTLQAGQDVFLVNDNAGPTKKDNATFLQGTNNLEIIAGAKNGVTNGQIHAENTLINLMGSDAHMRLEQDVTLDTADFMFANQGNIHLSLVSNEGSVISDLTKSDNAADEWKSIGATARDNITLEGDGPITLGNSGTDPDKSLLAINGNIDVIAVGNVDSRKDIHAGMNIDITAGPGDIYLGGDVTSDAGIITFHDEVIADGTGNQKFDAGLGKLVAEEDIVKTTPGNLNLGGDNGIELAGDVTTSNGDLTLEDTVTANGTGNQEFDADGGKLIAQDDIAKTTPGNLNLGGSDGIELAGDVTTSNGDLTLEDAVTANGTGNQRFDAIIGKLVAEDDIAKTTPGNLNLGGSDGIELAGDVTTGNGDLTLEDVVTANGAGNQKFDAIIGKLVAEDDIAKATPGNLNLGGSDGIELAGDVTTSNGDLTLEDTVTANGDGNQRLDAVIGKLIAEDDIAKTTPGNLNLGGSNGIELGGNVTGNGLTSGDVITFEDDVNANGTGAQEFDAEAGKLVTLDGVDIDKSTAGNLNLGGSAGIEMGGNVTTFSGDLTFENDVTANGTGNQDFDADGGKLVTLDGIDIDKSTAGNLNLGGSAGIEMGGNVNGSGLTSNDVITFEDDVNANGTGDQEFDAEAGKLVTQDGIDIDKSTTGNLNLGGNAGIEMGGNVSTSNGDLTFEDAVTANGTGNQKFDAVIGKLIAQDDIAKTTPGNLNLGGSDGIELAGDGTTSNGDLNLEDAVMANGVGNQRFDAIIGKLVAADDITKTTDGDLTLGGSNGIELPGNVSTTNGNLTFEDAVTANGLGNQRFDAVNGTLTAQDDIAKTTAGDLNLSGSNGIALGGDVTTSNGDLTFENVVTANGTGDQRFDAIIGTLIATDDITKTTDGDLTLGGSDGIMLPGDVTTSNGDLTFEDAVTAHGLGNQRFDAIVGTLIAEDNIVKTTDGDLTLGGSDGIKLAGNVATSNGNLTLEDAVNANGTGDQRFDAIIGKLVAQDDIEKTTPGNLNLGGSDGIELAGNVTTSNGNLTFEDAVTANGVGNQTFDADGSGKQLIAGSTITKTTSGNLTLDGGSDIDFEIDLYDDVTVNNGNLYVGENGSFRDDTTIAAGKKLESITGDVRVADQLNGQGDLTVLAGDDIRIYGDVTADGAFTSHSGRVTGISTITYVDGNVSANSISMRGGVGTVDGTRRDNIRIDGNVESFAGETVIQADDHVTVYGNVTSSDSVRLLANTDKGNGGIVGNVKVSGNVLANNNDVIAEGRNVSIDGSVTADRNIEIAADDRAFNGIDGDVTVGGEMMANVDILVDATDDITLGSNAMAGQNIILNADLGAFGGGYDVHATARGNLTAGGYIEIDASDETINLFGDTMAEDYIWLKADTKLKGNGDQYIDAGSWIRADGYVRKCSWGDLWTLAGGSNQGLSLDFRYTGDGPAVSSHLGNIWMIGPEDIQISGDVTTFGPDCSGWVPTPCTGWQTGGVLIYSMEGSIYTNGFGNALNVNVTGNSDHWNDLGIYNPTFEEIPGFAAIGILSAEDLNLGPNGSLNAFGRYYENVDDRPMINFLDEPANIGGFDRDQGVKFDLAIYTASRDGNVHVDMPTQIRSREPIANGPSIGNSITFLREFETDGYECVSRGTMVIDARDTVTFGPQFEQSLAGDGTTSDVGDRLEVASRVSEWLEDAFGRLPYANPGEGSGPFPSGYNYVLRGAGQENPDIPEGAPAWVLEARDKEPAPLFMLEEPRLKGCPVEMNATAQELGINSDQLQMSIGSALAMNPNLQPCDACARLIQAANILQDVDGQRLAAMNYVFNQIAPPDAPFTPEMSASIANAFSVNAQSDSQYATALEFVDAFVEYVTIIQNELQIPIEDPAMFALEKHGSELLQSDNSNIAAYVQLRLIEIGG